MNFFKHLKSLLIKIKINLNIPKIFIIPYIRITNGISSFLYLNKKIIIYLQN
jgi:hypothetical protein